MERQLFIAMALKYLGSPSIKYKDACEGRTVSGFDCSGFVNFLLSEAEYPGAVPRHCNEFFDSFGLFVHDRFRSAGDLVFFSHKSKGRFPDHMGILISREEFIHSPGKDGKVVCVKKLEQEKIEDCCSDAQIFCVNPVGIKRITVKNGRHQQMFLTHLSEGPESMQSSSNGVFESPRADAAVICALSLKGGVAESSHIGA
ncbi:MAG: hypothetical protein C4519_17110 [Desulfobacteraceae bacterium]|nr:MAG: hypothetical protein C4519_17110 [Desulfobacteraceae bacterium]